MYDVIEIPTDSRGGSSGSIEIVGTYTMKEEAQARKDNLNREAGYERYGVRDRKD